MFKLNNNQKGFAALFITVLVLAVVFGIAVSLFALTYGQQKIIKNIVKSSQAYYSAEAGLEDALLRLSKKKNWTSPFVLAVGDNSATVTVSDMAGGARIITSEGNADGRIKKVEAVYEITSEKISFYYGAQVGEGGLIMDDGSMVNGNIFSNGSITAGANTEITGTAKVAKSGNKIDGATIGNNAFVDICQNSGISGTLTTANNLGCTASEIVALTEEIATASLPILPEDIVDWKNEAVSGGTIVGDYILQGKNQDSLGPKKIEGNMTIQDGAKLYITGTIWVTGTIVIQNKAEVRLDSDSYGSFSGVLISDSPVVLQDSAKALGSGISGSYLLIISTDFGASAIIAKDNFDADVLFTENGWIVIQNTAEIREITGYGIHLKNDAEIIYEVGLEDASFSSGPGGSWEVTSWKEIE